jgi:hypothetical protein
MNLGLEVVNLIVSFHELDLTLLHLLLTVFQFLLQVCDLVVLRGLEPLELRGLSNGGLLCRP